MNEIEDIYIKTEKIKLAQFIKWINIVSTGGEAKEWIRSGDIVVNENIETKPGRTLNDGDIVHINEIGSFCVRSKKND